MGAGGLWGGGGVGGTLLPPRSLSSFRSEARSRKKEALLCPGCLVKRRAPCIILSARAWGVSHRAEKRSQNILEEEGGGWGLEVGGGGVNGVDAEVSALGTVASAARDSARFSRGRGVWFRRSCSQVMSERPLTGQRGEVNSIGVEGARERVLPCSPAL